MRQARGIAVISDCLRRCLREHSGLEACLIRLPVYGDGPFSMLGRFDQGFVTLINPCPLKGLDLFLALAREFPDVPFAVVPTWGATEDVLRLVTALPNVHVLGPTEDIDQIWAQTRVLLVPSLWPEAFGYVVPEAMACGIPVLAADVGGLPEAKLGVDYLLPVTPAEVRDGELVIPPQDVRPWSRALGGLLADRARYEHCSHASREAATQFVSTVCVERFEEFLASLATPTPAP